jgi:hypothetical protein
MYNILKDRWKGTRLDWEELNELFGPLCIPDFENINKLIKLKIPYLTRNIYLNMIGDFNEYQLRSAETILRTMKISEDKISNFCILMSQPPLKRDLEVMWKVIDLLIISK